MARRYAAPVEARTPKTPKERKLMLELYTPQEWQMEVHQCGARFRCVVCGRRAGKSYCGVNEIASYSWENVEYPSWWVAPTYGQAEKGFTVCLQKFESAIRSKTQAQGRMTITWKSGGKTVFQSAERYENLRGEGVGLMVLDEAAFMARAAWEQVLRPMLSDTMGRALFTTTPKGKNWVYGIFQRGEDPNQPDYASFKVPTVTSIYVPDSEVEEAKNTLPADVFAQEYCHLGSTQVAGADGAPLRFCDLSPGTELLYGDGLDARKCTVSVFRSTGTKPVVTVVTESGMPLTASSGHKVRTRRGKQAIEAAETLHYVEVPRYSARREEALARLVGYGIGDGSMTMRRSRYVKKNGDVSLYGAYPQASFYAKDRAELERVAADFVVSGLRDTPPSVLVKKGNATVVDTCQIHCSHAAAQGLIDAGFPVGNRVNMEFDVPDWVLSGSDSVKREFLAGLWGAEGASLRPAISATGRGTSPCSVVLSMSKRYGVGGGVFFLQLKQLMADLGVQATVTQSRVKGMSVWHLYVKPKQENVITFLETVGYRYAARKERLAFEWLLYLRAKVYSAKRRGEEARRMSDQGKSNADIGRALGCTAGQAWNVVRDGAKRPAWGFPAFVEWTDERRGDGGIYVAVTERTNGDHQEVFNITVDSPDHSYLLADGLDNFNCADFLDEAAGVFHGVSACVHGELYEPKPATAGHAPHRYAIGVDLAKHSDFTVIIVIDLDATWDGQVVPHVCGFTRMNTLDWNLQMDMIAQQSALYGGAPVLLDSTGIGDPIHDFLRAKGIPVFPYLLVGQRKVQLIQNLSVTIQTRGVSYPDLPVLLGELSAYQYTISPSGGFTYSAPDGEHDDTVISLALAVWAAQHPVTGLTTRFVVEEDPLEDMISPY